MSAFFAELLGTALCSLFSALIALRALNESAVEQLTYAGAGSSAAEPTMQFHGVFFCMDSSRIRWFESNSARLEHCDEGFGQTGALAFDTL